MRLTPRSTYNHYAPTGRLCRKQTPVQSGSGNGFKQNGYVLRTAIALVLWNISNSAVRYTQKPECFLWVSIGMVGGFILVFLISRDVF